MYVLLGSGSRKLFDVSLLLRPTAAASASPVKNAADKSVENLPHPHCN